MKVYVILEGMYSDRHIIGVTMSEGIRDALLDAHNRWDYEEYESDYLYALKHGHEVFSVCKENGEYRASKVNDYDVGYALSNTDVMYYKANRNGDHGWYVVNVLAQDEEHAIKIAQDKIAQYDARKHGITD